MYNIILQFLQNYKKKISPPIPHVHYKSTFSLNEHVIVMNIPAFYNCKDNTYSYPYNINSKKNTKKIL